MKNLDLTEVPSNKAEDYDAHLHTWVEGKCVMADMGNEVQIMLFHTKEKVTDYPQDGEPKEREVTKAFCFNVEKPITRDKAINAAEMAAYNLNTAMEVASFAASLSRKSRQNETSDEVQEHDKFIEKVKMALTEIGIK